MTEYRIDTEQDPLLLYRAADMLGVRFRPSECTWMSLHHGTRLVAVTVFSRFAEHHCEISIATWSPRWGCRRFIAACFDYVFMTAGKRRLNAVCEATNWKSAALLARLGFKQEARLEGWFGETDGLLFRLLNDECRWTNERHDASVLRAAA